MSLLTQASLIMTPNAVKESKVYSIIPSNGNGDLTFTRGTLASSTLNNDAGLVEIVPYNLLDYSEQFNNTSIWTKYGTTTVTADTTNSPNGSLTADTLSGATGSIAWASGNVLLRNLIVSPSTTYTFSIYVKSLGATTFSVGLRDNTTTGVIITTAYTIDSTWQRLTATYTAGSVQNVLGIILGNTNGNVAVWGSQAVQGSLPKDYFFTTDRLNVPRLNYDFAGSCPSLLLEPLRTNLSFPSNDFSNVSWVKSASSTVTFDSGILNPQNTAGSFRFNASNLAFGGILRQFNTATIGQKYTVSFFVKKGNYRYVGIRFNTSVTLERYPNYDFDTDTLNKQGVTCDLSRDIYSNGWVRLNLSYTATTVSGNCDIALTAANGDTGPALSGTEFMYIFGAQYELGAYATSYIPTVSGTVTRNGDQLTRSNIYTNGLITSAGGTWFIDQSSNQFTGVGGLEYSISLTSVAQNSLVIGINSSNTLNFYKFTSSVQTTAVNISGSNVARTKVVVRWNTSTGVITIFFNGTLANTFTSQTFVNYETLGLTDVNAGVTQGGHKLYSSMLFPTPLTDAECIALTSSNNYTSYSIMALNLNYVIQ